MPDLNEAKVELLFSTPILIHHWKDSEALNEQLRTIVLDRERASAGKSKSNVGGWQSTDDLASVPSLTDDSQIGANLRVCADEEDGADFDQRS